MCMHAHARMPLIQTGTHAVHGALIHATRAQQVHACTVKTFILVSFTAKITYSSPTDAHVHTKTSVCTYTSTDYSLSHGSVEFHADTYMHRQTYRQTDRQTSRTHMKTYLMNLRTNDHRACGISAHIWHHFRISEGDVRLALAIQPLQQPVMLHPLEVHQQAPD